MLLPSGDFAAAPASEPGRIPPHVRPLHTARRPQFWLAHFGQIQSGGLLLRFALEAKCVVVAVAAPSSALRLGAVGAAATSVFLSSAFSTCAARFSEGSPAWSFGQVSPFGQRPLRCQLKQIRALRARPASPAAVRVSATCFASPAPLPCGARACDYVGTVRAPPPDGPPVACAPAAADKSDYELDFGAHSELSLDAHIVGNEGRFLNDFRNTGRPPNVEFRLRADRAGALRQGIFVSAKRGVEAGDELLVSYGKPYWRARVGSLDAFVTRRPAREAAG